MGQNLSHDSVATLHQKYSAEADFSLPTNGGDLPTPRDNDDQSTTPALREVVRLRALLARANASTNVELAISAAKQFSTSTVDQTTRSLSRARLFRAPW